MIFSRQAGSVSVRTDEYRLAADGALFDMRADPGQRRDIRAQQPEVAARLSAAVARWKKEVLGGPAADDRPYTVGYREFPTAPLPARDGVPSGGIRRSARAPNCSYFTNWRSTEDKITWDIDVHTSGNYEAVVYYTCPKDDVGATLELRFGESSVRGKVTEAFDPPFSDGVDRVPREGESHVKEFRPLRLGVVHLDKGRGPLVLCAVDVPGGQVADVRKVELTLVK